MAEDCELDAADHIEITPEIPADRFLHRFVDGEI